MYVKAGFFHITPFQVMLLFAWLEVKTGSFLGEWLWIAYAWAYLILDWMWKKGLLSTSEDK